MGHARRTDEDLLFLKFRDCSDPTRFRDGKGDLVAGMHSIQRRAILCLELFCGAAGIRSNGPALLLLNRDGASDPVDLGDSACQGLLPESSEEPIGPAVACHTCSKNRRLP